MSGRLVLNHDDLPVVFGNDYDEIPFAEQTWNLSWKQINISVGTPRRTVVGHMAALPSPRSLTFVLPESRCGLRQKVSITANNQRCSYATNAGFFNMNTGACIGNLVTSKRTVQLPGMLRVSFGSLGSSFVIGFVNSTWLEQHRSELVQMISGAGWLVRHGQSVVEKSAAIEQIDDVFVKEKAPRTGLGVDSTGRVILLVIDGVETLHTGVDLFEFAAAFQQLNVTQAMNLDGGGSSVAWSHEKGVVSRPTCDDTPTICERTVTSITCVSTPED